MSAYKNILTEVFLREGNLSYPKLTADEAFSNLKVSEGLKGNLDGTDGKQSIQSVPGGMCQTSGEYSLR